jgi:nucleotide-binding universal stress UspA family protein
VESARQYPNPPPPGTRPKSADIPQILVCLDRSELSEAVFSYAVMLARTVGGVLKLTHVIESSANSDSESHDALAWELKHRGAHQYMEQLQERIRRLNVPVDIQIEEGRAAEKILGYIRQHPVDFVILASHGSHGLAEWSLSSTAAKITGHTNSSFIIVPATPAYQHPEQESCIRRILVPLDGSLPSQVALPMAVRIAKQQNAELILAHAIESASFSHHPGISHSDREIVDAASSILASVAHDFIHQIAARLQGEGIKVSVIVTPASNPIDLIYEIVASRNIDFIAMSAHGLSGIEKRPQSLARTSAHMASHTPVPLLIVQDIDREQISQATQKRRYDSAPLKRSNLTFNDTS